MFLVECVNVHGSNGQRANTKKIKKNSPDTWMMCVGSLIREEIRGEFRDERNKTQPGGIYQYIK